MALSHYVADSWLIGIYDNEFLNGVISNEAIPNLPVQLTTTYFEGLLPGLIARYGKDQNVTLVVNATKPPNTLFQ